MKIEPHLQSMLPQVELRVLYGPQAGSRLTLSPGEYMLGSGDECAVILAGPRIQASHATLSFDGNLPSITPLDGEVYDSLGNALLESVPLALGMPFEIGGIWVTIDDTDAPWPEAETIAHMAGLVAPVAAPAPAEVAPPPRPSEIRLPKKASMAMGLTMGALSLLALTAIGGSLWLVAHSSPQPKLSVARTEVPIEPVASRELKLKLAELSAANALVVTTRRDGTPEISGYVEDRATLAQVQRIVRQLANTSVIQVLVDADLIEAAAKTIGRLNDPARAMVKATSIHHGSLMLSGAVASPTVRENLFETLKAEVPGLRDVNGNLFMAEDLPALLQEKMMEAGLAGKLQVIERQPTFLLRGKLSESDMPRWEKLLLSFNEEFGSLLPIRATISLVQSKPPVGLQMIVGGPMPFIVTDSGQKIGRGGNANGNVLTIVRDNEVVFEGKERYKFSR